jgi:glutamate N-acetyltransferase / amino-acid N-acetyltransferase
MSRSLAMTEQIAGGGITSPRGFSAGAVHSGVRYTDPERLDFAILASELPCVAAGLFTRSTVPGAPVTISREHIASGRARAIVANSGIANVATGARGLDDARQMCALAGEQVGAPAKEVLVASTGVIGWPLPMEKVREAVRRVQLAPDGGDAFARAIMTTDSHPKQTAVAFSSGGRTYHVGGCAKGAAMLHPDMGTMFGFVTTDAPIASALALPLWRSIVTDTFNMVSVDGDTSTSDTAILLANGAAGGEPIAAGEAASALRGAIFEVTRWLARALAEDGEGASKLIEVRISGARTDEEARHAARIVSSSPLVKAAVFGNDFNWGRVLMAVGRSGAAIDLERAEVQLGDVVAYARGGPTEVDVAAGVAAMKRKEVIIAADLGVGSSSATAWGCDLTDEYVRLNADYTT